MGQELTLPEVNKRWPRSSNAPIFKTWLNDLMKVSNVNLAGFFGDDKFSTIPTGGKQYEITMSKTDLNSVRKIYC